MCLLITTDFVFDHELFFGDNDRRATFQIYVNAQIAVDEPFHDAIKEALGFRDLVVGFELAEAGKFNVESVEGTLVEFDVSLPWN